MVFSLGSAPVSNPPTLRFEQNGGVVDISSFLRTGYNNNSKKTRYEVVVNGGVLNLGTYLGFNYSNVSSANIVTNVFTLNGGTVNVGTQFQGNMAAARSAPTFVTLNGGTLTVADSFDFTANAASKTVLDLNAGSVFAVGCVKQSATGGTFNFNGGTFVPLGTSAGTTLTGLTALNVSTNGVVIDTSRVLNGTYTIAQALAHDARLGSVVDGGLVKKGTGTLVLSAANTFTGLTRVEAGVLKVAADGAIPAAVSVGFNGTLDLGGTVRTIPALVRAPGFVENGTLTLSQGFVVEGPCENEGACPLIDADLTIASTATLDLGLADGAEGPSSSAVIPLAYVTGTATVPGSVKAVCAGKVKRFDLSLQSGLLVAKPSSGGTVILFR